MDGNVDLLVGVGIYTVPEAARLTGVSSQRIRRWLTGYSYQRGDQVRRSEAVWRHQLPVIDESLALGFRDLMEVRFIDAFRGQGVSWKTIRLAASRAIELFDNDYPFSTRRFVTDGKTIFAEIIRAEGKRALLDIPKSQYAFRHVVSRSFQKGLEFSQDGTVIRWWPLGEKRRVVLDPSRAFGQPIVSKEGIPTLTLVEAVQTEGSIERVAKLFDVERDSIRDAIRFEESLAA